MREGTSASNITGFGVIWQAGKHSRLKLLELSGSHAVLVAEAYCYPRIQRMATTPVPAVGLGCRKACIVSLQLASDMKAKKLLGIRRIPACLGSSFNCFGEK